jgi:hypothetical protein
MHGVIVNLVCGIALCRERYTKMGKEMEAAKGKNRVQHASIMEKMREMFRQDKDVHVLLFFKS